MNRKQSRHGSWSGALMISIIMPSFNQAEFIARAIDSVFQQNFPEVELIITDGGSTDGTIEIIKKRAEQYVGLRWISEPDDGPASALNKSLEKARGTIIGWLNSDDCYRENIFEHILSYFENNPEKIMVYGEGEYIDDQDNVINLYPTLKPDVGIEAFKAGCFICQPTVFFRHSLYVMQGPLDEGFKASFDYEYWLRSFSRFQDRIGFIDKVIAQSRLHTGGITHRERARIAYEGARLCRKYFEWAPTHWLVTHIEEIEAAEKKDFNCLNHNRQNEIFALFDGLCHPEELSALRDSLKS